MKKPLIGDVTENDLSALREKIVKIKKPTVGIINEKDLNTLRYIYLEFRQALDTSWEQSQRILNFIDQKSLKNKLPLFGCQFTINKKYHTYTARVTSSEYKKHWEIKDTPEISVVFLGFKTLREGTTDCQGEEGRFFTVEKVIKVMSVCAEGRNPIYVPMGEYK